MTSHKECGIAIVGCGTVGGATASYLIKHAEMLAHRCQTSLVLRQVVDVNWDNARRLHLPETLLTKDLDPVLRRDDIQIVAELVGGTTIAKTVVEKAIAAGKNVVTANKALLAKHGAELWALARKHNVTIAFEASCAGAIPIIAVLTEELACDNIEAMYGIVNGTCNYILSAMTQSGQSYADALKLSQQAGLAEADPTLDVAGVDSAHKLSILAALAFGKRIDFGRIYVEGIDKLQLQDIQYGHELGYVIKLLAIARRQDEGVSLRVHPSFISTRHPLAWVSGPFNAISVYAENSGHTMYYGRGAGGAPTSAAVIGDMMAVALGTAQRKFQELSIFPDVAAPAEQVDIQAVRGRYYLRMQLEDKPGVLANIAQILGMRDISISSVLQHEPTDASKLGVPVVITTHPAREGDIRAALEDVNRTDSVKAPSVCIRILEEHPERVM